MRIVSLVPVLAIATLAAAASAALAADPPSEETIAYFKQNCASCHTIGGGRLTGPDLKNVTQRRTREQLAKFIPDPKSAIDGGDPYLVKLWNDANGVYMPPPPGITPERAQKLLDLIEAESALEKSQFAGGTLSDRPLTDADVERGRAIFEGSLPLVNGAPACIACHGVEGAPGFGGGRLGPDLTGVFARLGGRKALGAWLTAPQSVTMTPVFRGREMKEHEILGLVAYLKERAENGSPAVLSAPPTAVPAGAGRFEFLVAGVGGLLAALAVFDFLWRNRFRSVRRAMVEKSR
jgi:mono/diheme cytochrome c family protein